MCCCCPDAIQALFCLYVQSGCKKGTVAGALTFFPPEPPFYRFDKELDDQDVTEYTIEKHSEIVDSQTHGQTQEQLQSPVQQLTAQAAERRKKAKERQKQDESDYNAKVKYTLWLDPRLPIPNYDKEKLQTVKIPTAKGSFVASVIYECPKPDAKILIYSHGNATDLGAMFPMQVTLSHALDIHVVSYDYSGYGSSGGVPEEDFTYSDLQAVYQYVLKGLANNDASRIVLYGQSVGSGPCCYLAAREDQIGGMILHSPFTSGMRVLTSSRILGCLDIYPNIDRISNVNCPVMIIHGRLDQEVDFRHGVELHNQVPLELRRDPWWVADRGHNDITEGPGKLSEYIRRLRGYFASL